MSLTWCSICKSDVGLEGKCQCITSPTKLKTISFLPNEFVRYIELDLNKITGIIPEHLLNNIDEFEKYWKYPNIFEFLVGYCVGTCNGSYVQAFMDLYKINPASEQVTEIRKMVSRRRSQIEQGVNAFLDENFI